MKNTKSILFKRSHVGPVLITMMLMLVVAAVPILAHAQTYTVLYNFDGTHGSNPEGNLAQGRDGTLYGTTIDGGTNSAGVVFRITPTGNLKALYNFLGGIQGGDSWGGLTLGRDGNFYGTTTYGGDISCGGIGCGTVFKITAGGSLTNLYSFTNPGVNGCIPEAPPIQGTDGNFYGTTGCGTAYKITSSGTFTLLASFYPEEVNSPLLQGTDGNFYGTTAGSIVPETVFKITSKGTVTIIYEFGLGNYGTFPGGGALIQGTDGNFYGTAEQGGSTGGGVVFRLTPRGTLTVLHNFPDPNYLSDGSSPFVGLVQATDGNFYGSTRGGGNQDNGVIFQITPAGAYSILHYFGGTDGANPYSPVVQHTDGKFYGLAGFGGASNAGVVYSLDLGLAPFVSLVSAVGKAGRTIEILGQGFIGTTDVYFNGTPTTFKIFSDTDMTAIVPTGVTTAPVTVVTPSGTLTSNKPFRVLPTLLSFSPSSGPVGTSVTITGLSLTQTERISFGGAITTAFTVNSDSQVTATVPAGAKTGNIQLTTLGGQVFSQGTFTVIP